MLTLFLILVFAYCGYTGYRRGVFYQGILTIGYFLAFGLTALLYKVFIPFVTLFIPYPSANSDSRFVFFSTDVGLDLDKSFYAGAAFILVLLVLWIAMRILLKGFNQTKYLKSDHRINRLGAILLSLIVTSVTMALVLFVISTIPVDWIQEIIDKSFLAKSLVLYTPIFSSFFKLVFI